MLSGALRCVVPPLLLAVMLGGCAMTGQPAGAPLAGPLDEKDRSMMRVAAAANEGGDSATAIGLYRKLSQAHPDRAEPAMALGQTLLTAGAADEALSAFKRAAAAQPNSPDAQLGMGHAHLALGQLDQASVAFDAALVRQPTNIRAMNGKAVIADLSGRHDEAQKIYLAALAVAPDDKMLWNNLGLSLTFSRQYEDAIDILSRLARQAGATPKMRQNLALALGLSGKEAAAAQVSRVDLGETAVAGNLRFYALARELENGGTARAIVPAAVESRPLAAP